MIKFLKGLFPRKPRMYFRLFRGANGEWYFQGKAMNNEVIFQSEGYKNRGDAMQTMHLIQESAYDSEIRI